MAGAFTPYFLRNFRIEISGFVSDVQAGGFGWGKKPPGAGGFSPVKPPMVKEFELSCLLLFIITTSCLDNLFDLAAASSSLPDVFEFIPQM